jgi:hypothetical protein
MCVGHHYPEANTNNVNKTRALLQTTGGKDEPNIVCMRKSQHGSQNVKTHNRRTLYISSFYFMQNFVAYEFNFENLIGFSVFSNISSNWS